MASDIVGYYEPMAYVVPQEADGWLLKAILQRRMTLSRRLLSQLKKTERGITVNGERRFTNTRVYAGDLVEVRMAKEESKDILPEPMDFKVLYEDDFLLIVDKAAGIIVHPTHGHYTGTLANGIVHYWRERGENVRFRPVHRLDQETSGVLCVAKNPFVHQQISVQMIAGRTEKDYLALVHGRVELASGSVDAPIGRDSDDPHLRTIVEVEAGGAAALTHYEVVRRFGAAATLVRLRLATGRTHQIRVHMRHVGHPLVGDKLYAPEFVDSPLRLERQALHAARLAFVHPGTGEWREFVAPLPEDVAGLVARLGAGLEGQG
jgi:23S rRNA pseudouridine1911/1915/1917 synthase